MKQSSTCNSVLSMDIYHAFCLSVFALLYKKTCPLWVINIMLMAVFMKHYICGKKIKLLWIINMSSIDFYFVFSYFSITQCCCMERCINKLCRKDRVKINFHLLCIRLVMFLQYPVYKRLSRTTFVFSLF